MKKNNITVVVNNFTQNLNLLKNELNKDDVFLPIVYPKYPSRKINEIIMSAKTGYILFVNPSLMMVHENIIKICKEKIHDYKNMVFNENDDINQDFIKRDFSSINYIDSVIISTGKYRGSLRDLSQYLDFTNCMKEVLKFDRDYVYFPSVRNTLNCIVKDNINDFITDIRDKNTFIVQHNNNENIKKIERVSAIKSNKTKKILDEIKRKVSVPTELNIRSRVTGNSDGTLTIAKQSEIIKKIKDKKIEEEIQKLPVKSLKDIREEKHERKKDNINISGYNGIDFENISIKEIILEDE